MIGRAFVFLTLLAARPSSPSHATAGTLVLKNASWDAVQVDVRLGPSTDCAANRVVGTRTLNRDQWWTIVTNDVICWRREAVPGDVAHGWTTWTGLRVATGTKQEVVL